MRVFYPPPLKLVRWISTTDCWKSAEGLSLKRASPTSGDAHNTLSFCV